MSESDSDLDFESADEDAEFATSTTSKVSQKSASNEEPCKSFSTEGDALSAFSDKIGSGNLETDTYCLNMSPKQQFPKDEKETVDFSAKLKSSSNLQGSKVSEDSSNIKKDSGNAEASMGALAGYEQKIDSSERNPHPKADVPAAESTFDLQSDKSRKPEQQTEEIKSRQPSDFVNILSDPNEKKQPSSWDFSSWGEALTGHDQKINISECNPYPEADVPAAESTSDLQSDKSSRKPEQKTEELKSRRERVVLRLEKKKQLSKESPVENEKPSDFVNILQDPNEKKQPSSWGFSSWGSSLLSTAASSVSTFSSQVSQGIGSVLETVESTLGAPPPEELAQTLNEKKAETEEATDVKKEKECEGRSSLLPGMSSWTKVLENTGSKVIMGGLDTLELIGKKTMDILTEGDPGLRKRRAAFASGANLSELLREIKARADEHSKENPEDDADNVHYSQIFDEKQGLVHLEALEMLSKQSQAKFQRLLMRHSKHLEVKKRLVEIKSICENIPSLDDPSDCESFEDFEAVFKKYILELSFPLNAENIIKTQREIIETIRNYENAPEETRSPPKEIFQSAICSLADFTAKCIETFHKAAELILVQPNLDPDLEHCATNLTGLTTVMCIEVNNLSSRYHKCLEETAECLQKKGVSENVDVKTLATNVYVEASNSNNYIQDAYQMLVPVLQVRFLEAID